MALVDDLVTPRNRREDGVAGGGERRRRVTADCAGHKIAVAGAVGFG